MSYRHIRLILLLQNTILDEEYVPLDVPSAIARVRHFSQLRYAMTHPLTRT